MKPRLFRDSEILDEKNSKKKKNNIRDRNNPQRRGVIGGGKKVRGGGKEMSLEMLRALPSRPPLDPCNPAVISMAAILTGERGTRDRRRNTF